MLEIVLKTKESKIGVNPKYSKVEWIMSGDRVLIKHHVVSEFIEGTENKNPLYRPKGSKDDHTQEDFAKGEIVSIGPGHPSFPTYKYYDSEGNEKDYEVGLIVNYFHQSAIGVEIDGEKYHLVRTSDIFAIV